MNYKRGYNNDIQNKGCDWEIEAIFFKNWADTRELLRRFIHVKNISAYFKKKYDK